jgi:creatinine amidohydrolase
MGGLDKPATVVMEDEDAWQSLLLRPWLEKLCSELHRQGFRAILMLTGHYGHNQQIVVREVAVRMTERLGIPVLGTPEYWLALDEGYLGDHAGIGETSLLMYLEPELVRIERLDDDPEYGADDRIRHGASPELGARYAARIVERLAALARRMPSWDAATRAEFAHAEAAVAAAQLRGWRARHAWAAWTRIGRGEEVRYGADLAAEQFDSIVQMAARLES